MDGLDAIMAELSGSAPDGDHPPSTSRPRTRQHATRTGSDRIAAARSGRPRVGGGDEHAATTTASANHVGAVKPATAPRARNINAIIAGFTPALQRRVAYFEQQLKHFAFNVADPASRIKANQALSRESFDDFVGYYRSNPKLAKYSVKQDLQRLDYSVIKHGRYATRLHTIRTGERPGCEHAYIHTYIHTYMLCGDCGHVVL